jgi:signal transduction histidine kinase
MNNFRMFDELFDTVLVLSEQTEIIYFNNQASVFFKLPPRLLRKNKFVPDLFKTHAFDLSKWIQDSINSKETQLSPEIRISLNTDPENDYFISMKLVPLLHDGPISYGLILHDMTVEIGLHSKYREQVEELKKTHSQIMQADKLSTIGELTANISHEINNPLLIAAGNSDIIKAYLSLPSPMDKINKIIAANKTVIDSLERVNQIIKNMKEFLHKSEEKKEYCSMTEIIESASRWVRPVMSKANVKMDFDFLIQPVVLVNRLKIEQVIINLLKNSSEAIAESGATEGHLLVRVCKSDDGEESWIDVIDDGPGVPEIIKKNLFKPFQSTKDSGNGTGLGLSICSKIIESHTGKLELIDSSKGSHFRISLPLVELYSLSKNDRSSSTATANKRVMVLDDDVVILNVLNSFFADLNLVFIGSSEPSDALFFIQRASIDLIIMDIEMPDINSREFTGQVRQAGYMGPIIYLTGEKNLHQFKRDAKELNISGMIMKPFNKDEAVNLIITTLGSSEFKP